MFQIQNNVTMQQSPCPAVSSRSASPWRAPAYAPMRQTSYPTRQGPTSLLGQLSLARQLALELVGQHPDDALTLIAAARIDAKLGHKEDAIREGEQALSILREAARIAGFGSRK